MAAACALNDAKVDFSCYCSAGNIFTRAVNRNRHEVGNLLNDEYYTLTMKCMLEQRLRNDPLQFSVILFFRGK
jgi:hypothetical protein